MNIPDIVFEAIIEERQRYEANRRRRMQQFQDLNYICCSTYGRPCSAAFCYQPFKQLLFENNLPNIRFHDLRHTYSTLLLKENLSVKAISKSLGHSKTIITVDVYCDKSKIVEDCINEIQPFIEDVLPPNFGDGLIRNYTRKNTMIKERIVKYLMMA